MKNKNTLVIFDLISTLTDSGPRYAQALREVCVAYGYPAPEDAEVLPLLGNKSLKDITAAFAGGMTAERERNFMRDCNDTCDSLLERPDWHESLFPHVREAVETLHLRGAALGIYTGTRAEMVEPQLAWHNISAVFDPRYRRGKDNERDAGKTSEALKTEQMKDIAERFRRDCGSEDIHVVVVGDSSSDVAAARACGFAFVGFAASAAKKQQLEEAGATAFVEDYADLPDLALRLATRPANDNPVPVPARKHVPQFRPRNT